MIAPVDKKKDLKYNEDEVQKSQIPSGLYYGSRKLDSFNKNGKNDTKLSKKAKNMV